MKAGAFCCRGRDVHPGRRPSPNTAVCGPARGDARAARTPRAPRARRGAYTRLRPGTDMRSWRMCVTEISIAVAGGAPFTWNQGAQAEQMPHCLITNTLASHETSCTSFLGVLLAL